MLAPEVLSFDVPDAREPSTTHRVSCAQWGKAGEKPTLLCVHGLTRNGRDFDYLADALAADFHILAPDVSGRGKSQWLSDVAGYNNPAYVADVMFILNSMGIKKLHWLGTSMGGIMGMIAAFNTPGIIQSMVINDIGCFIPASGLERIRDIARIPTFFETRTDAEAAFRLRSAGFGITDETVWKHLYAFGIAQADGGWRFTYDPAIFSTAFALDKPMVDMDLWPLWEGVKNIPVLLVRGTESELLLEKTAHEMKARHTQLTLVECEGAGHAPALMSHKEIAPIREWMSAIAIGQTKKTA